MTPRQLLSLLLVALAPSGCTFGVSTFERDVPRVESGTAAFTTLRADFTTFGVPFEAGDVVVRGVARQGAAADVRVAGLAGAIDLDAVESGVHVGFTDAGSVRELRMDYEGPSAETVWLARAAIELPRETELDLISEANDVDVEGLDGLVRVSTSSGAIRVRSAGAVALETSWDVIDVAAASGQLTTHAGRITMALEGAVMARSDSGWIEGSFGEGGLISAGSGSIDVELATALTQDLELTTDSGSITLVVPVGASFMLEAETDSGTVHVEVGAVSHHGEAFAGAVGAGGPFAIRARTRSGPIHVIESTGA